MCASGAERLSSYPTGWPERIGSCSAGKSECITGDSAGKPVSVSVDTTSSTADATSLGLGLEIGFGRLAKYRQRGSIRKFCHRQCAILCKCSSIKNKFDDEQCARKCCVCPGKMPFMRRSTRF